MIVGTIKGVHCNACISLIKMELDEIGVGGVNINQDGKFELEDKYKEKKDEIKAKVDEMEGYELIYD